MLKICQKELDERIDLNFRRLADDPYYGIDQVFTPIDYSWMGDKEGRALLAFVSHYKMSGRKIDCMEKMMAKMPERLNALGYLGACGDGLFREEQLSGHSWLLRGLCEYYGQFDDERALLHIKNVVNNLYMPLKGEIAGYPVERGGQNTGGVSGEEIGKRDRWLLSSDTCAAFMSIDGLTHAYAITRDDRTKELVDEMIFFYSSLDKVSIKAQTHCTLTSGRGMMRMYGVTGDDFYLECAKKIWDCYEICGGMTYSYQNANWWGRHDSWTEPCAVVDSLMLALEIYKATNDCHYRTMAARVWHNGFATLQRPNGGAGPDDIVSHESGKTTLALQMYEAPFCCTMRLAEGLWYVRKNSDLLFAETSGKVEKNEKGIYSDGDIIYAELDGGAEDFADTERAVNVDGHRLFPIVKLYRMDDAVATSARQRIVFDT